MPRMNEWHREAHEAVRRELWSLKGPNQVVKVLPNQGDVVSALGGYITVGRFLLGKTPLQIEQALGLKRGSLRYGVRIYRFTRLPSVSEYEYELTADHPDGLAYHSAHSSPAYPPGSRTIPQWRIKPGTRIPVDADFLELKPGDRFPYNWLSP